MKYDSNHIDEHILSLYVLNDPTISARRGEITQHLAECRGCRELFEEITSFYSQAEQEVKLNPSLGTRHKHEIVPQQKLPSIWAEPLTSVVLEPKQSLPSRLWYFSRRRPILSTSVSFAVIALCWFLVNIFMNNNRDTNPSYHTFKEHMLNIHNREGEILWRIPLSDSHRAEELNDPSKKLITLFDINNDGNNEVITIFNSLNDHKSTRNSITVYNPNGTVLWRKYLGKEVVHDGTKYMNDFITRKILVHEYHGKQSIFVVIANAHSPSAIVILDLSGNIVGEYWNYGHFSDFEFADVDRDNREELVVLSLLDSENVSAILALEPEKIVGVKQSQYSAFQNMEISNAEKYSTRVVTNEAFSVDRIGFSSIHINNGSTLSVYYGFSPGWLFTCVMGDKLHCESILLTDSAIEKYGKEGAAKEAEKLKRSFRYWERGKDKPPA